jgi:hypothetical protein
MSRPTASTIPNGLHSFIHHNEMGSAPDTSSRFESFVGSIFAAATIGIIPATTTAITTSFQPLAQYYYQYYYEKKNMRGNSNNCQYTPLRGNVVRQQHVCLPKGNVTP